MLFVLLIGFILAVLFWVGTVTIQGYWYSEPTPGIAWRAPAAAAVITVFVGLWCILNWRGSDPDRESVPYDTINNFSASEAEPAKGFPRFWSVKAGKEIVYERRQDFDPEKGRRISGAKYV